MIILRILGGWALITAIVAIMHDALLMTRGTGGVTSLGQHWQNLSGGTMAQAQAAVEGLHPLLWSPLLTGALSMPAWLFFAALATVLYSVGRRRRAVNIYAN